MTPPEFSVLLLAWDDADPNVAVLGGATLPPTLPLVYQLAAQQPVLAVYPHLPPAGAAPARPAAATAPPPPAPLPSDNQIIATAETLASAVIPEIIGALETAVPMPGVLLLPGLPTAKAAAGPQPFSRLVGLAELADLELNLNLPGSPPRPAASPAQTPKRPAPAVSRSQWPTGANAPVGAHWQAPAAPYLGAESTGNPLARPYFPPPPPAPPRSGTTRPVSASRPAPATRPFPNSLHANGRPHAGDLHFDPDPELPPVRRPEAFDEPTEEIGPAEAGDISAPADDLLPDAPLLPAANSVAAPASVAASASASAPVSVATPHSESVPASVAASAPASAPAAPIASAAPIIPAAARVPAAPVPLVPAPDGLSSRMIQYARQAAQLVRGRSDFGVIYAPSWPAWLAALEIRNSSRRPLVLYAASLATDLSNPAEHGYQLEMERMTMRRATLILVPDEAVRRRLQTLYQDTIGKVRVVPAADETTLRQLLAELAQTAG